MSDCTTSNSWVKGIVETLDAVGLNVPELLNDAGIDRDSLNTPGVRYSTEKLSLLWELAVAQSNDPAIGIAMSHVARPASFDVLSHAMMSCENLLSGFEHLVCYLRIVTNATRCALIKEQEGYWLTFELHGGWQAAPRQRMEFNIITLLSFCRWVTMRNLRPLAVELTYPVPVAPQAYANAFNCPLRFGAASNRVLFSAADLLLPLSTYNPVLADWHEQHANACLERLNNPKISRRLRELITESLAHGEPLRKELASALCMSERTLQRRLHEEGTSFQQLVDDARRTLARQYLHHDHLCIEQIAYQLKFADHSTFSRACKRWFNMSPAQYRIHLHTMH